MSLGDAFKSFWHSMTSYDRHSNYDSPYRTGRHVPLDSARGLTSVATGFESRHDLSYSDDRSDFDSRPPFSPASPSGSYSPGLRSQSVRTNAEGFEVQSPGDVPMQAFRDGMPPAPPVSHSWRRIDAWAEEHYPELFDQICEGATRNDMNDLEHQLDSSLPADIRESWMYHDGQERGGMPTGVIFSNMLLDCEEIVQEWENWRTVNAEFLQRQAAMPPTPPARHSVSEDGGEPSSSKSNSPKSASRNNPNWRQDLISRQDCVPAGAIQRAYSHPAWIPLVRDWGGNNLAVDLHPGPTGHWGQIILFGRDYDTKYVIARSWAHFLAIVADDLCSNKWFINEDTMELKLREFKSTRVEPGYFDILRWRMDQKYGRRPPNRKSMAPTPRGGTPRSANTSNHTSPTGSPYMSPTVENQPSDSLRGRSLQRLSVASPLANSPLVSPSRPGYAKASPLARVTEEGDSGSATPNSSSTNSKKALGVTPPASTAEAPSKLLEIDSPVLLTETAKKSKMSLPSTADGSETAASTKSTASSGSSTDDDSDTENEKVVNETDDGMKTIEI
ncbi:Glucan synthesis regulatory protein [Ceratocystis fimbriata CBS 114723]|uniref:Glucan synthesis regulatory protein n=1 Tax=Ceratocystis fimbriata CBS 114723 TaxID=1035309 RepID=A0A2C5X5F1_9PEZI|nr:Glucan synthesis regulatory protein [Ceratocystis fimbriata CBS 114723]